MYLDITLMRALTYKYTHLNCTFHLAVLVTVFGAILCRIRANQIDEDVPIRLMKLSILRQIDGVTLKAVT